MNINNEEDRKNRDFLKKLWEAIEGYNPDCSCENKKVTLIINGEKSGETDKFVCGLSASGQNGEGKLILGFSGDNAPNSEKVELVICLNTEFRFPLRYIVGYRAWLLKIPCRQYSRVLRDNLDRAVANGAVRIEVITKSSFASIETMEDKGGLL